jgi:hypothetical protein
MNAVTGLAAMVSLLLALAGPRGAAKEQAGENSPTGTRSTTSRMTDDGSGCPEWGCGSNHNETMVSDATSAQQPEGSLYAPTLAGCPIWFCGSNHNETLVDDVPLRSSRKL